MKDRQGGRIINRCVPRHPPYPQPETMNRKNVPISQFLVAAVAFVGELGQAAPAQDLKLWYDKPARRHSKAGSMPPQLMTSRQRSLRNVLALPPLRSTQRPRLIVQTQRL